MPTKKSDDIFCLRLSRKTYDKFTSRTKENCKDLTGLVSKSFKDGFEIMSDVWNDVTGKSAKS